MKRQHTLFRRARPGDLIWPCLLFLLTSILAPSVATAQTSDDVASLARKIDALQKGQQEIQKELKDIRTLLTAPEDPVPASLDLTSEDTPFRGQKGAKVALIEYFDYQCPYCASFSSEAMPQLLADYILKGKVKYIVRNFPLEDIHSNALQAAEAAHCANDQGKFWPMHDVLMKNSDALDRPLLSVYAQRIGLDVKSFDKCVNSGGYALKIRESIAGATKIGVDGTPTFFLGVTNATGGKVVHLQRMEGDIPFPQLKDAIDHLLAAQKPAAGRSSSR